MIDLDSVFRLIREAIGHMEEQDIPQWDDIYPGRAILKVDIERRQLHVMEEGGIIVGCITLNEEQAPEYREVPWAYEGRVLVVHRLTIRPLYQGRKYASCLMDFAEKAAKTDSYNAIRLDAFTLNSSAVALYEGRGYRKAGTVRLRKGLFHCYEKTIQRKDHLT
jgi:GNAT superfamily N-acetyltransferase